MIVATIALIAAVAGTTYAQTTINGADIKNKSIAGQKLKNQSVGTAQLRNLGVQSADIQSGAITVSKLRSGSVTAAKLARGAVGTAAIANNSVTRADLQAAARVPTTVLRTSVIAGATNGTIQQTAASCNSGETLIAGGGGIVSAPVAGASVLISRPEANPGQAVPVRWLVVMSNNSGGTIQFQAYAVCATTS
jgi:hypothetical protein